MIARRARRHAAAVAAALLLGAGPVRAQATATLLDFADLAGWAADDHAAALAAFRETCDRVAGPDWATLCALAASVEGPEGARSFFEALFRPVLVEDGTPALLTGYFEPELPGSRTRTPRFRVPLYALPPEAAPVLPPPPPGAPPGRPVARGEVPPPTVPPGGRGASRAEVMAGALAGRGLEIGWVEDPVDAFFLQVQGSGRLRLPGGALLRLGYAGSNGRPYSSIGQALLARGALEAHQLSAAAIRHWARENPDEVAGLLALNESYVYFREVSDVPPDRGPIGAMGRSVTPLRSLAVDPAFVPLGAPVWLEREGEAPRLMVAQDTGSAIKGAQRADIFFGTGPAAGLRAGRVRDAGRLVVLLPIQRALAMVPETVLAATAPPPPEPGREPDPT